MNNRVNVILADANTEFRAQLAESLERTGEFTVAASVGSGAEALLRVRELRPQLLVTDLILPELDGFGLIDRLAEERILPKTVIVSALYREQVVAQLMAMDAALFIPKPCELPSLIDRLRQLMLTEDPAPEVLARGLEHEVSRIMQEVGVPAHVKGYRFVREAILLAVQDESVMNAVTGRLYPSVARVCGSTPARVERAMRGAIELAWDRGSEESRRCYFGQTISCERGKPTNSEFVAMLADHIRLGRWAHAWRG